MAETFYACSHCGNIITFLNNTGVPVLCCGEPMGELIPDSLEASEEKHIPVYEIRGDQVHVQVGAVKHPMIPEHYIQWVVLETNLGSQKRMLSPEEGTKACFALCPGETVEAVYAYCNIHGLWKST